MIEISHIHKTFSEKGNRVEAVQDVSPRYRNIENYELPPQMVNQNENVRRINNPVMNQNH